MPKIPISKRTISQFVEEQIPDFVRDADPQFVAFLRAYYEWLEKNGADIFTCKIVDSSYTTVKLTDTASTKINAYHDMSVVVLNGPAKGYTRKITAYDPITRQVTVEHWDSAYIPPPNTRIAIRAAISPGSLLEYRDIDKTLDNFIDFYRNEFLYQIPGNILADKRNILKHIKDFYQARGTEDSFRFLFRILFNEEIEFYYPKVDLFRASDARWYVEHTMKTTTTGETFDYVNRQIIGVYSGATAKVESATKRFIADTAVTEFKLSNIDGEFAIDPGTGLPEQVKIVYPVDAPPQSNLGSVTDLIEDRTQISWEQAYQLLQKLLVDVPGQNYAVGETITISGGGGLSPATAVITEIFQIIYNGRCSPPPTTYWLEPFYGPTDVVNTDGNPLNDKVCIPGLYYYLDVRSDYTSADLLNPTEIKLSQNETTQDDFFVGDEIALVGGTGVGQRRTIVSYNGTSKVATVDADFTTIPDETTQYSITHLKGGIKAVKIIDFGLGFLTDPTITIHSTSGSGASLPPFLGLVGTSAGEWTVGRDGGIGGAATTTDSFASSNKIIQDSYYWQDFSYDIRVGETIDKYRDVVKALLHPAGFKMFGTVLLNTKPKTDFLRTVQRYVLQIGIKYFDLKLSATGLSTNELEFSSAPLVLGTRNKDLDHMKFTAFPPNVRFTLRYPFPNQDYWKTDGPGNTQIEHFKNIVIGTIINNPDRRTKTNADAFVIVNNANSFSRVGPVGQTKYSVARSRFFGFPPFEGFFQEYPAPNENYWTDGYGNTQLTTFKDLSIEDYINRPKQARSNIAIDANVQIYKAGEIPLVGDLVEYAFLEGMNSQIVYNTSPNSHGIYDGTLGTDILTQSNDGAWVSQGLSLTAANQEIVNATGIPLNLKQCTVIVVAYAQSVASDTTIVSSIPTLTDNGFGIDITAGGGISFRARYDGTEKTVNFPAATVADQEYFMASLRFDNGKLSGNVNNSNTISVQFSSYPSVPTTDSDGWYFGKPSTDFTSISQSASLYKRAKFGTNKFSQAEVTGSTVSLGYFDGYLCYAIFYDRAIYNFELDFIYANLSAKLNAERGITF